MSDYDKLLAGLNTCAGRSGKREECAYDCASAECVLNLIGDAADALTQQRAEIERLNRAADFIRALANGEKAANDRLQERLRMADAECAGLRREIDRLTAESRAKEQYIAEHMGGTAERNARMRRDAERLRGTTAHAFADTGSLVLKDKYT